MNIKYIIIMHSFYNVYYLQCLFLRVTFERLHFQRQSMRLGGVGGVGNFVEKMGDGYTRP